MGCSLSNAPASPIRFSPLASQFARHYRALQQAHALQTQSLTAHGVAAAAAAARVPLNSSSTLPDAESPTAAAAAAAATMDDDDFGDDGDGCNDDELDDA